MDMDQDDTPEPLPATKVQRALTRMKTLIPGNNEEPPNFEFDENSLQNSPTNHNKLRRR